MSKNLHFDLIRQRNKLSNENFGVEAKYWKKFFQAVNAAFILDLSGTVPAEKKALDEEINYILFSRTDDKYSHLIEDEASAATSWKKLVATFQSDNITSQISAYKEFTHTVHDLSLPISAFVQTVEVRARRLEALGNKQSDSAIVGVLSGNVKSHSLRRAICGLSTPTLSSVKNLFSSFDPDADTQDDQEPLKIKLEDDETVLAARSGFSGRPFRSGGSFGGSGAS